MATCQRRSAAAAFPLRKMRISRGEDFRLLYRTGRRFQASGLRFYWIPSPDQITRAATIVRKKTARSAVVRNRVRRAMREVTRSEMHLLPTPCWMLFDVKEIPSIKELREAAKRTILEGPRCANC